jgi:hypothetical protein
LSGILYFAGLSSYVLKLLIQIRAIDDGIRLIQAPTPGENLRNFRSDNLILTRVSWSSSELHEG